MLGRGIMRGRTIWLCPFKANASGQLLAGTECKREMGKTWLIKTASAQGSSLLSRAVLSAVKHLLTPRPAQRDCLDPRLGALKAKQVRWLSMRPCPTVPGVCKAWMGQGPHSPGHGALALCKHKQDALSIQKRASLYASAQILWWQVLKLMWEEEVHEVLFKITSSSYLPKRGPMKEKAERSVGGGDSWWVTSDEWRGPRGKERWQEQLGWLWEVCRESGFCVV